MGLCISHMFGLFWLLQQLIFCTPYFQIGALRCFGVFQFHSLNKGCFHPPLLLKHNLGDDWFLLPVGEWSGSCDFTLHVLLHDLDLRPGIKGSHIRGVSSLGTRCLHARVLYALLHHPVVSRHVPALLFPKGLRSVTNHKLGCALKGLSCLPIVIVPVEVTKLNGVCLFLSFVHLFNFLNVTINLIIGRSNIELFNDIFSLHNMTCSFWLNLRINLLVVEKMALVLEDTWIETSLLGLAKDWFHCDIFQLNFAPVYNFGLRLCFLDVVLKVGDFSGLPKASFLRFDHFISKSISDIKLLL